jgi:hypothetical protein
MQTYILYMSREMKKRRLLDYLVRSSSKDVYIDNNPTTSH